MVKFQHQKSSISTLTSTSANSENGKVCSLQSPIHKKINCSSLSKSRARDVRCASDIVKTQIKLLSHKTWHSVIIEFF